MRTFLALTTFCVGSICAQSASTYTFEVASVKRLPPGSALSGGGGGAVAPTAPPPKGNFNFPNITLRELIRRAYGLTDHQIAGPDWLASEHYSIAVKLPENTGQAEMPEMLRALLADRFHFVAHHEQRSIPIYALIATANLKLKSGDDTAIKAESAANERYREKLAQSGPGTVITNIQTGHMVAKEITMARLAEVLIKEVDRPLVDMTGLTGTYSFVLDFLSDRAFPFFADMPERTGDPLPVALKSQLGLALDKRNAPTDVLVVDRVEKTPTDN